MHAMRLSKQPRWLAACISGYRNRRVCCRGAFSTAGTLAEGASSVSRPAHQRVWQASPGGWLLRVAPGDLLVAVVDGTNVAMRCRRSTWHASQEAAYRAWLRFFRAVVPAQLTLVTFDNKGSAAGNARTQLHIGYNKARYRQQSSQVLPGWSYLDGATRGEGCVPLHAAVGYEADDVMASLVHWLRSRPEDPAVVLVSSDSDMQQLMCPSTFWLEPEDFASQARPSALRLHTAREFEARGGYPPSSHPCFLALTGKKGAAVAGTGVSERSARRLVQRYGGDLGQILEVAAAPDGKVALGPQVQQLLAPGTPGAAAAQRNLALLTLGLDQYRLPAHVEVAYCSAAGSRGAAAAGQDSAAAGPTGAAAHAGAVDAATLAALVDLHPSLGPRWQHCERPLALVCAALRRMGLPHVARWVSGEGLPIDLVVRVYDDVGRSLLANARERFSASSTSSIGSSNEARSIGGVGSSIGCIDGSGGVAGLHHGRGWDPDAGNTRVFGQRDCVAVSLVLGSDNLAGPPKKGGHGGQPAGDLAAAERHLSPGAKRSLSLLKTGGWRVAKLRVSTSSPTAEDRRGSLLIGVSEGDDLEDGEVAAMGERVLAALMDALKVSKAG